jgi:acetolactate decarboxylase
VADLLRHGDFGLGTFDGLDGEGIPLEGRCWQARADGRVVAVPPQTLSPFLVVTRFRVDRSCTAKIMCSWCWGISADQ